MCQYHSDTRCGLCDGPLEVDRDAICHKCCSPSEQYELIFDLVAGGNGRAMYNHRLMAVDLCCGAGGWAAAARGLPIEFIAVADIVEDCLETWRINHANDHPRCQIIKADLSTSAGLKSVQKAMAELPVDLVLGGIPCEEISIARANKPPDRDTMETWQRLLNGCLALVDELQPRWWCFEDVPAVIKYLPLPLWHGREIPYRIIDAAEYGPQSRVRAFVGQFPEPVPPANNKACLADVLRPGPYRTLKHVERFKPAKRQYYSAGLMRVLDPRGPSPTIVDWGTRHARGAMIPTDFGPPRLMEWQEAARLQGFPENYVFAASWSRTWKLVAQAIPIYVGRAILAAICEEAGTASPSSVTGKEE